MNDYLKNGRFWRLCLKELRESLRDRRTIVTLVLMPILVYPLLSMALQRLLVGSASRAGADVAYAIGVPDETTADHLQQLLIELKQMEDSGFIPPIQIIRQERLGESSPKEPRIQMPIPASDGNRIDAQRQGFKIYVVDSGTPTMALNRGSIDLAVTRMVVDTTEMRRGKAYFFNLELEFRQGDAQSEAALAEIRRAMQTVNDRQADILRKRIDERLQPIARLTATGIGTPSDPSASIVGVLPLVLILMTITGAVYPAIDLTAGERERGTMEALIATPAPRFALLMSKYVAVVCVAILTALANLFAAWITLSFGGLGQAIFGKSGFSIWMIVQVLPLLAIFAAFFSAILLALCSFARSFKEAQAYLIPVMLISLGPGLVTLMPNIEFTPVLGVVPLVNMLLLSRDIMTNQSTLIPAFAAVFSTIIYAAATLVVASRLFGAESATSGSQDSWADLLGRPKRERMYPSLGELAVYLAALFPVFFVLSNVGSLIQLQPQQAMIFNAVLLVILFMMMPLGFAWYRRLNVSQTFRLDPMANHANISAKTPILRTASYYLAGLLMSAGLWMVAFEAYLLFESWSLTSQLSESDRTKLKETFLNIPFALVLVTGAAVPAIAEEYFFRGFALSAFLTKFGPGRSLLFTALLFGVFHVIAGSILSFEKFLPTLILGVALGFLAVRSGSLWPGVLLHGLHNSLVFGMSRFSEKELAKWFGANNQHLPLSWLLGGLLCIVLGAGVLYFAGAVRNKHEDVA
jgi:ABC-2 type transport system permease protein/sodium transport system permease protein